MILEIAVAILVLDRIYQGGRQVYLQYKAEERAQAVMRKYPRFENPAQWVAPNNQSQPD